MATPLERLEGKYEILEKMSEGGMGSVYKVKHRLLDEIRVIKVMRPHLTEDDVLRARFVREAKTAIRLNHRSLVSVYDFTMDEGGDFFLVMEFIDGMDLLDMVKVVKVVPLGVALEIANQSLSVLNYLHSKDIVHRDISPDNLLITRDEEGHLLVKLIDLGIAKVQEEDEHLTATGTFLGKVRYSSPEHFKTKDADEVSSRSDIYSFAIVLYEMLTGKHPIKGSNLSSLIAGHLMHPPIPFSESDPEGRVPGVLQAAIMKALAKEPAERFQSANEFQAAIDDLRADHLVTDNDIRTIFEVPTLPTMKIQVGKKKKGSTQAHIDRSFGVDTTPAHGTATDLDSSRVDTTQQILATPPEPRTVVSQDGTAVTMQVRALVLGAEKLLEGEHIPEARLQLDTARQLDPSNSELVRVSKILEAADAKIYALRKEVAAKIEVLIGVEQLEQAKKELASTIEEHGEADVFTELEQAISNAENAIAERAEQVTRILNKARQMVASDGWEDAAPMVREAMVLDPDNKEASDLLEIIESGLIRWRENQRRQKEIDKTIATIAQHIVDEDPAGAQRSLGLARKLYGRLDQFTPFDTQITELEDLLEQRRLDERCQEAHQLIEAQDFDAAVKVLDEILKALPDHEQAAELLAAAREGQRLKKESENRQKAINDAALSIDRLILAGRLETAVRTIDSTVTDLGDFDLASALRSRVESELSARENCEAEITMLLKSARTQASKKVFEKANDFVAQARDRALDFPELTDQIQETGQDVDRQAKEHRRGLEIEKAAASISQHLDKGELEEAKRELDVVVRLFGDDEAFQAPRERFIELSRVAKAEVVEQMVKDAMAKQTSFTAVIDQLEDALRLDPGNERVQRLLTETRGAHLRHEQENRNKAIIDALAGIDQLIAAGQLKKAMIAVDETVAKIGDFPIARSLRHRLRKALDS